MRNRLMILTAALLLASAGMVMAQQEAPTGGAKPSVTGTVDIGFRATSTTGDEARYERYRDTRNGAFTNIVFGKETANYLLDVEAQNVGYHDQRYLVNYQNSKLKFSFLWDSTPLNYGYNTSTPWVETQPNMWSLDTAARTAVQNGQIPAGFVAIPNSYVTAQLPSIYRALAKPFDMQQRRDQAGFNLTYEATEELGLSVGFTSTHKNGYQPFGMSYAFSNANELPMQLDNRTNDLTVAAEWVKPQGMFRVAFDHSAFSNKFNAVEWDSPFRATDFNNGLLPPSGPYNSSGYSNGQTGARGRISSFPDSTLTMVSVMGLYKMPRRTTINGTVQLIDMNQDDDLIPWSNNSTINQPVVWAAYPNLASLERPTAEAKIRAVNALLNFSSRPTRKIGFNAKYRHNTHANLSRSFDSTQFVRFGESNPYDGGSPTHPHSIVRDTFDASVSFNVIPQSTLRVGYGYDNFNRTLRAHNDMRDNAFRVTLDTIGNQYLAVTAGYEFVKREGFGFSEHAIEDGHAQPGLRYYDEANRDRNRANAQVTLTPNDKFDIVASVAYTKDEYGGPGLQFGLLDNKSTAYNIGINVTPMETVAFGANYGRDDFSGFQKSRNANPAPDPSWTDPTRDWTLTNDEKVNNFDVYLDLIKAIQKTDVRIAYMFSDSDNGFLFGGPRIATLAAARDANGFATFEALPNVTNKWQRLSADIKIALTEKVGIAAGYWYEKLEITDFATINLPGTDTPRIDYLGGIMTGYGNRPYSGSTATFRILYFF